MELPFEIQRRAEKLAVLSPSARRVLEQELTVMVDDQIDIDPEAVRQELFIALINDLKFLGVYFSCTPGDVYGPTWQDFDEKVEVLGYILPNQLYPKLQDDPKLRHRLQNVLWGVSTEPLLQAWLESISFYCPKLTKACQFFIQHCNTSPIFVTMLENMNTQIQDENRTLQHTVDDPQWNAYKDKVIKQAHVALNYLVKRMGLDETQKDLLERRLHHSLKQNLESFENVNLYKFLFLSDILYFAPEVLEFWKKKHYEFCVSNKLLPEYYSVRKLSPTVVDLVGILIYQFASARTPHTLREAFDHIGHIFTHLNENIHLLFKELVELKEKEDVD